jgi:hypothetical protein
VLAGATDEGVVFWNASDWSEAGSLDEAAIGLTRMALSRDGAWLAVLTNQSVSVWNVGRKSRLRMMPQSPGVDIAFHPGGTLIVALENSPFAFFNPESGKEQLLPAFGRD